MTNPVSDAWLRQYHHVPHSPLILVCFPHAGGSATFFHPVSAALQSVLQVIAVQYPGRQERHLERPLTSITELADGAFAALRPMMDRPLAFFGHSMGATLAFEVAVRMQTELAVSPLMLFVSGRRAPSRHRNESIHQCADEGIIAELKALNGTDPHVFHDQELLRMILPAIRSDYTAAETYRWQDGPELNCPIVVLTGDDDPKVAPDEAQAWRDHTTGPFELHAFPGGHFYLTQHAPRLISLMSERLEALNS